MSAPNKLEPLGKFQIYVSSDHTFGTDAVLLSNFAASGKTAKFANMCDLGTGCGIIPLLLLKDNLTAVATGVEIQPAAAQLARESAELNGVTNRFCVLNCDLKDLKEKLPHGSFELVTCNPPYKAEGAGIKNETEAQKIARHEIMCCFDDITKAAAQLLKFSGRFCVCHRPERLADIICSMRANGIEPKRFREVIQRKGGNAWLLLIEGRKGGKPGMVVMPPLYIEENGEVSDELLDIYGDYKEGRGRKI